MTQPDPDAPSPQPRWIADAKALEAAAAIVTDEKSDPGPEGETE